MTLDEYKPGNTVMLKSGSPEMTIRDIDSNGIVRLVYFDEVKRELVSRSVSADEFVIIYGLISAD